MYRKKDANGRTAYSSADAYRALHSAPSANSHSNSGHNDSSEDETNLRSPVPTVTPIAAAFSRRRSSDASGSAAPLSPPKPFFLGDERNSWSSENNSVNDQSDSDSPPAPASSGIAGVGAGAAARTSNARGPSSRSRTSTSQTQTQPVSPSNPRIRARNHRRRSSIANEYTPEAEAEDVTAAVPRRSSVTSTTSPVAQANPFDTPTGSVYGMPAGAAPPAVAGVRAPPSAFPFLSHPGNPDPGTPIPGVGRRSSLDSIRAREAAQAAQAGLPRSPGYGTTYPVGAGAAGYGLISPGQGEYEGDLGRPYAPFMEHGVPSREGSSTPPSPMASQNNLYRNSAAAAMAGSSSALNQNFGQDGGIPRTNSSPAINMRAPFLSPASRPSSSLWAPPSYPYPYPPTGTNASFTALPRKAKPLMPSSRLPEKLTAEEKPWLKQRDCRDRASWWLTFFAMFIGVGGAAVLCFFGYTSVHLLKDSDICIVMDENFDDLDLTTRWQRDVELGGFGNGEFQMTTDSSDNLYVQDGQLYIMPTFTSDKIGRDAVLDGGSVDLGDACTTSNKTACSVKSDKSQKNAIQPVQSARISTMNSTSIAYGKIEVRAKIPRGDWLWPAIWMLPKDNKYGAWPMSGEIDLMEARGNAASYTAQGVNFIRASLNYGVLQTVQTHIFGWWSQKQSSFDKDFHVYSMEWTPDWMRFYVDSRLQAMMNLKITGKGGKDFFKRGNYPATATNGSAVAVVVQDIWSQAGGSAAAPFDQEFYLIIDLAVGGTSGWFPDNIGGKMWFDGSRDAMWDFASAQDTWAATWPDDANDRAFRM
ncbi:Beta-1,3-glucan-binding protein [Trametes pubescens]|uniref:Beta-1,3-glucan-binding protein n=1 Tax=Trametes pubescens TaxID=154538 RepID=A0A1M2W4M2_TRAPU|nr:Beta-1,3-glucan-binding protein [Trametes pubescens]